MDIGSWLGGLGLGQYEAAFRDNDVDLGLLPSLTADDLRDLGVASVGHRRRLLASIAELSAPATAAMVPTRAADTSDDAAHGRAERRQLTVMFVDLVGSTELSRALDPEDMGALIRAYQTTVAGEITRFEGHIAKFMGDGVLAYFGWPAAHEDEAERAIRAGLAIAGAVAALPGSHGKALRTRVGIATGMVVVGDLVGEGAAQEETVIGETPNLAARLQERAEPGRRRHRRIDTTADRRPVSHAIPGRGRAEGLRCGGRGFRGARRDRHRRTIRRPAGDRLGPADRPDAGAGAAAGALGAGQGR